MKRLIRVVAILSILSTTAFAGEGGIGWKATWDKAKAEAAESSRHVLILFTNPERCPPCRRLEANTLPSAEVTAFINDNYVPFLAHTGEIKNQELAREFGIRGIPTFIVADSGKNEITRVVGYRTPGQLIESLKTRRGA